MKKQVALSKRYPDLWRRDYLYPACERGDAIALVGIGDIDNYSNWDWASVDYSGFDPLYLHHHAKQRYGVFDISDTSVEQAKSLGVSAYVHDMTRGPLPERYDVVFAGDVIEHSSSPVEFLRNMTGSTTRDGYCVITTPNPHYWRSVFPHPEEPSHWFGISKLQFQNLARLLNLEILELTDFRSLSPFAEPRRPVRDSLHHVLGNALGHNSLLMVFRQSR